MNYQDDFNLYKIIAKNVTSAVPKDQLEKDLFTKYIVKKSEIPKKAFIYYYWHCSLHSDHDIFLLFDEQIL